MFFHHHHDDSCQECQDMPNWARHFITRLEEIMSYDQDHLDGVTARLEVAVTAINAAVEPPLNFAALDKVVLDAEADVLALPAKPAPVDPVVPVVPDPVPPVA